MSDNENVPLPDPATAGRSANDNRPEVTEEDYLKAAADAASRASEHGPVSVDPDVADFMGAFEEDALTAEEALDSLVDAMADDLADAGEAAHD